MLHIVLWKWHQVGFRDTYTSEHVNTMAQMITRNMPVAAPYRIVCVTDDAAGIDAPVQTFPLWKDHDGLPNASGRHLPSCYRRLRLFDPEIQQRMGVNKGDRICSIDLDTVIIGQLNDVMLRKERFVGWGVRGQYHPRVFNGSFFQFGAGDLSELWTEFDPKTSPGLALKGGFMGSDQGWLSHKLARAPYAFGWGWPFVASYPREVRRMRVLDRRTRIIFFHGARKPWQDIVQKESPWVKRYWRQDVPKEAVLATV